MGTYTKPDIIKQDPFGAARAGIQSGFKGIATAQAANKKAELAAAKLAAKNKAAQDKLDKKKSKQASKWKSKLNSLDQVGEQSFQTKFQGFVNNLIDTELMGLPFESNDWNEKVGQIETYVDLSNTSIQLLEREVEQFKAAFTTQASSSGGGPVSVPNSPNVTNSRILTNNPEEDNWWLLMNAFVNEEGKGVQFSTGEHGGTVGLIMEHPHNKYDTGTVDNNGDPVFAMLQKGQTGPNGQEYKDPIELNFTTYKDKKADGYDLIDLTNREDFNKGLDGTWDLTGGKSAYETLKSEAETILTKGNKITTQNLISYENANQTIIDKIAGDLDAYLPSDPTAAQNNWQLLGKNTVFDRTDPVDRATYADLLSKKVIEQHQKDDHMIQVIKNIPMSQAQARLTDFKDNGIPIGWTNLSPESEQLIGGLKASDGTPLLDKIQNGKITPKDITTLVHHIGKFSKSSPTHGDAWGGSDVLKDILNHTAGKRMQGKVYKSGDKVIEDILDDYSDLYQALHPSKARGNTNFEKEVLDFAAGKLKQQPHDRATWSRQDDKLAHLGLFSGADRIKNADLWETGVGRAKQILEDGVQNWSDGFIEEILYSNLNLSKKEQTDLRSGFTPPGTKSATKAQSNVKLGKSYADRNAALAAVGSSNKKPIKIGNKWYLQ